MQGVVYQFGDFTLDAGRFELSRLGQPLSLERKPLELLMLLAERDGQLVSRSEIADRLWDRAVFVDTEHGINTAIRKIRYALRDDPDQPRYIHTVTGKGYRLAAPVTVPDAGNPACPPTPEILPIANGSKPISLPPAALWRPATGHAVWVAAALLLAAAATGLAIRSWIRHRTEPIHSLAVLPLDNLSGDAGQDYFADGMTDELTTMLAKNSTLRIVSRTSVMQYKRAHRPLPEIARALNVDGIVEGSVSRSGRQIHLTLQLIQASTDSHLWAESYDRDADDVALPNDAARAIAIRLHNLAPTISAVRYVDPAAHDAFLRGRYLWFTDRMDESGEYFRRATQIQPDYADAWAWLSVYYGEGIAGHVLDPRTSQQPEWDTAQRAMQLDPDLADAHWAMGAAFFLVRWDFANADREFLRAIDMDPRSTEYVYVRACMLEALNRFDEAIAIEKKAMEVDPFERPYALASLYPAAGQYDAALAEIRLRLEADPNNLDLLFNLYDTQRRMGNYRDAVDTWAKWHLASGYPQSAASLRRAWEQDGAPGFIHWQLDRRLMQAKTSYVSPGELALYYAQLDDREKTLNLLEESYRQHQVDTLFIQSEPAFDFLHADPRYRALVRKMGLPASW
ncbi:MAG TPA: winged helix-turn-helix domain-containing protein [Acidobacteriaceae bacterium]|jgi:TolB-like protein/DNA-binding winged helix-turn-helix (wHTH) protein|nr:winged helix-turn-helix domain-containing protein [Acidobacteriaceae bacterium]